MVGAVDSVVCTEDRPRVELREDAGDEGGEVDKVVKARAVVGGGGGGSASL